MKKHSHSRFFQTPVGALLRGELFFCGAFLLFSAVMAVIADISGDPTPKIPLFSLIGYLLAAAVSGFWICARQGERGMLYATLSVLSVVLLFLLFSIVRNAGAVEGKVLMNHLCCFLTAVLFALLGKRKKPRRRRRT